MSMDIERHDDGHWHFKLGPIEKWVVAAAGTTLMGLAYLTYQGISDTQLRQGSDLQDIKTQQAVTNAQLSALSKQLSDVPVMRQTTAEIKVQVLRNTQDIRDLQHTNSTKK